MTDHTAPHRVSALDAAAARPRWQVILIRPETMTFVLLVAAVIVSSLLSPYFLDINYILASFTLYAEFSLVALVLTIVIISGEIDLSPASNMALSACLFAWTYRAGLPMPLAILVGIGSGMLMGVINGLLVIGLELPSIIVTIGTLTLYRGLAQIIAGDQSIRLPQYFIGINTYLIAGVPVRSGRDDLGSADLSGRHERNRRAARGHSRQANQIHFVHRGRFRQFDRRTDHRLAPRLGAL